MNFSLLKDLYGFNTLDLKVKALAFASFGFKKFICINKEWKQHLAIILTNNLQCSFQCWLDILFLGYPLNKYIFISFIHQIYYFLKFGYRGMISNFHVFQSNLDISVLEYPPFIYLQNAT
jgi:hypothetical protein